MKKRAALPLDELRAYLLPKTLEYAVANSTWYAKTLGKRWRSVHALTDLHRLPELTKDLATDHQAELRCGEPLIDLGRTSSGTTRVGARFFRVEHSGAELEAIADYHRMTQGEAPKGPLPLVLHISSPHHGVPRAEVDTLQLVWAPNDNICGMVQNALETSFEGRRVEAMRLSISVLKQLTVWFLNRGISPRERFEVKEIGTNASLVTRRWRALVEETWGARIWDNYSLSEVTSAATQCGCGWYHFGPPPVVIEVVDPISRRAVTRGVGLLLLTTLYPYAQRQPLIRYVTNDLVELGPPCERVHDWGLRFKGRLQQTVLRKKGGAAEYLLFPSELEDVADDEPAVLRHDMPFERLGGLPAQSVGQPKVRASLSGKTVKVELGVRFDPRLFPEQAAEVTERVRQRLAKKGVALKVELVRPGDEREWFVKNSL